MGSVLLHELCAEVSRLLMARGKGMMGGALIVPKFTYIICIILNGKIQGRRELVSPLCIAIVSIVLYTCTCMCNSNLLQVLEKLDAGHRLHKPKVSTSTSTLERSAISPSSLMCTLHSRTTIENLQ